MKRFVQAACVAGAVILSAAGCCSSCGSKQAAAAPPYAATTPVVTKSAMPATTPTTNYGYAGKASPQLMPTGAQPGSASVTGEMPSNYKMPGN